MKETGADREGLNQQTEVLGKLLQDSTDRSSDFMNKSDEMFDAWSKEQKIRRDLITDSLKATEKFTQSKSDEDRRADDTANYKVSGACSQGRRRAQQGTTDSEYVPDQRSYGSPYRYSCRAAQ